jgi:nitrate reductase NapAB chaperone NapD
VDRNGKTWLVEVTVPAIGRIDTQTGFNINKILDEKGKQLNALVDNPVLLIGVLYAICEPQIKEREMTPEEFGISFVGDQLRFAALAILRAMVVFLPSPDQRELLRKMIVILEGVQTKRTTATLDVLDELDTDAAIEAVYEELLRKAEELEAEQTTS